MLLLIAAAAAVSLEAARRTHDAIVERRRSFIRAIGRVDGRLVEAAGAGHPPSWRSLARSAAPVVAAGFSAIVLGRLTGPVGWPAGAVAGWAGPVVWRRRKAQRASLQLEGQLADLVESASLAVRAGLSIAQALEFAAGEAESPMREVVARLFSEQRLGITFERALERFADAIGTDDARLFVLVVGIHSRSGGDLAGALDEVATTVRHRMSVRRELRALSAQGRVSGGVLGSLPLLFFLVLAATSRRELEPVYRSLSGMAMIGAGLAMQTLAYLWIRRMLRVEV